MIGSLYTTVLDTSDINRLSAFYSAMLGWERTYADGEWVTLTGPDGTRLGFQRADDHVAPQWPEQSQPQQAHLDLRVPDLDAATEQAQALGATLLRKNESWHTLADPSGHPFDVCRNDEVQQATLMGVMLDCPDAKALSSFYSELLGKPVTYEGDGMAMIGNPDQLLVLFQQVEAYAQPKWPDPAHPQQFHIDVMVEDVESAERATLALGATRLPGEGKDWRVYADPAGKPFCLVWDTDE